MPVNLAAQRSRSKAISRASSSSHVRPRHAAQLDQVGYEQLQTSSTHQPCNSASAASAVSLPLLSLSTLPSKTHGQSVSSSFCTHQPWPHPKLRMQKLHLKPLAGLSSSQRNAVRTLRGRIRCPVSGPARRLHTLHPRQETPIDSCAPRTC
jgi:hypothetical protein